MTNHTGRTWRSLQDTTVGAQMLFASPNAWSSARRNTNFYPESGLVWLEADTLIRVRSKGKRSLDDFCKLFFGSASKGTPYSFEDVVKALNQILPYDWNGFMNSRLDSLDPGPPLGGIDNSGWRLVYTDQKSDLIADMEAVHKIDLLWPEWHQWAFADLRYSIGLLLQDDGTVLDSAPGMSGYEAGIVPGMIVVRVNGARFSLATMETAIRGSKSGLKRELSVANGRSISMRLLDYHDGSKYPYLQRDLSKPDLLREIVAPTVIPPLKRN